MRVLYLSDNISGHNRRFLQKLGASGHDVIFCDVTRTSLPVDWLPVGVRPYLLGQTVCVNCNPEDMRHLLPALQKMLADLMPDIVQAGPLQTCGYITALAGFHPMLLTSWGSDLLVFSDRDETWRNATQTALAGADGLFVDSDAGLRRAREFVDISDAQVVRFPWGIESGSFGPEGALPDLVDFRRENGTCVLLCTRAWEPLYRHDLLLQGFHSALASNERLRLILIGHGSRESWIRGFVREHGLEPFVNIVGPVDHQSLSNWFRVADVYVSCAEGDGTSISMLEAMATGLPVILTDIPSNREWVTSGENGWLASTPETIAAAIVDSAALTESSRAHISQVNRALVAERANWNRNFPLLIEMYERLLARGDSDRSNPRPSVQC